MRPSETPPTTRFTARVISSVDVYARQILRVELHAINNTVNVSPRARHRCAQSESDATLRVLTVCYVARCELPLQSPAALSPAIVKCLQTLEFFDVFPKYYYPSTFQ
jgi:hypothetical protein